MHTKIRYSAYHRVEVDGVKETKRHRLRNQRWFDIFCQRFGPRSWRYKILARFGALKVIFAWIWKQAYAVSSICQFGHWTFIFLFLEDVHRVRVCLWRRYCVYIRLLHVIEYDFNLCLGQGHVIADFSVMTSQSKTIDYKQSSIKFRFKVNGLWVGWIPRNFKIFIFKV